MFVGIDVGSTAIKLGLVDIKGKLISYFTSPYNTNRVSEKQVEQDPNDWINLILKGLSEFQNTHPKYELNALSICSQVNTHIFIDKNGEPLMPAIFWQDVRAKNEAKEINDNIKNEQKISLLYHTKKHYGWGQQKILNLYFIIRYLFTAMVKPKYWKLFMTLLIGAPLSKSLKFKQ